MCNGDFDNAWSKTMVGYGPESEGYALELTYNYGVRSYKEGNALESILIAVPDLAAAQPQTPCTVQTSRSL